MVLSSKEERDYRVIGLVEVMWKVVAEILNHRLTSTITFHNFFHGFRVGRGTGTATLEAKLLQHLAALKEEVLYVIFLDLHKFNDALDRSRCLEIFESYGVVTQSRRILQINWRQLVMVSWAGGYYWTEFQGTCGVTQGQPLSPTIFNVVVDAVVRHWVTVMVDGTKERGERGQEGRHQDAPFYADYGMVALSDP